MFDFNTDLKISFTTFKFRKCIKDNYTGELANNIPNGFGTCVRKFIKYTGEWYNGLPHGKGIAIYKRLYPCYFYDYELGKHHTYRYEGKLKDGYFDGKGILCRDNKKFYEGEFREGTMTGYGTLYNDKDVENNKIYEGNFKNGQFNGYGIFFNKEGHKVYVGNWITGQKEGFGKLYVITISKVIPYYEGYFKKGKFNGRGKIVDNIMRKSGIFVNSHLNGTGTYEDKFTKYQGEFVNDQFNGYGTLVNKQLNKTYIGNFNNNTLNGKGTLHYSNNNVYEGNFTNNLRNGDGIYYDMKGNYRIEATWKNDKKEGCGSIIYNDGNSFKCTWKNDKLNSKKRLMFYEVEETKISLKKKKEIPYELICPISLSLMIEPVICSDGHTYDKKSIITLFSAKNYVSPTTREKLKPDIMIPNYNIKKMIENLK